MEILACKDKKLATVLYVHFRGFYIVPLLVASLPCRTAALLPISCIAPRSGRDLSPPAAGPARAALPTTLVRPTSFSELRALLKADRKCVLAILVQFGLTVCILKGYTTEMYFGLVCTNLGQRKNLEKINVKQQKCKILCKD